MRIAILLLLLTACGPAPTETQPGVPHLRIGTGRSTFEPLRDGDSMGIVRGSQGGLHVDVAVQMFVEDPEGARLSYSLHDVTTGERLDRGAVYAIRRSRLVELKDHWLRMGDRAIFETVDPGDIAGRTIEVKVRLRLEDDTELTDQCDVVVEDRT